MGTLEQAMTFPRVEVECEFDADAEIIFHPGSTTPFLLHLNNQRVPLNLAVDSWEKGYEAQVLFPGHPRSEVKTVHCFLDEESGQWCLEVRDTNHSES